MTVADLEQAEAKKDEQERERRARGAYPIVLQRQRDLGLCEKSNTRITDKRIELEGTIDFELDSDALTEASAPALQELKQALVDNPSLNKVEVAGHADSSGDDAHNVDLTRRRAETVRAWLVANGIATDRLASMGYSSYCPRVENDPKNAKNRRVELAIVERDKKPVEPGWGGCEAAAKKGLKKPVTGAPIASVSKPASPGTGAGWQPGQKLPDTFCGNPFPAAEVTSKEFYVPVYYKDSPFNRGLDKSLMAGRVKDYLEKCDPKEYIQSGRRTALGHALVLYAMVQPDPALRSDALGHAITLVRQRKEELSKKQWNWRPEDECSLEAEVALVQGDLGFVEPLAECLKKAQGLVDFSHFAWFALDVAEAKKQRLDLSPIQRKLRGVGGMNDLLADALAARMKVLAGADLESTFMLWNETVTGVDCSAKSYRWLLEFAPAFAK